MVNIEWEYVLGITLDLHFGFTRMVNLQELVKKAV